MPLRVVFFGNSDSEFSNRHFRELHRARCRVVAVVDVPPGKRTSTNIRMPGAIEGFVDAARREGIPCLEPASPNSPEFVSAMRALAPDVFVAVGYMNLLKEQVLTTPRIVAANFHASLLPAYRGKHPVFWALRNGERWVGLTVHVMDPNFDTGDILYQVKVRTLKRDTVNTAYKRIMDKSVPLVRRLILDAGNGQLTPLPQAGAGASYFSSVNEEDFRLDWSRDAEVLRRWVQTSPGQCFIDAKGGRIFFLDAQVEKGASVPAGAICQVGRTSCVIAAGNNGLRVRRVRVDGVDRLAAELVRAAGLGIGKSISA